MTVHLTDDEIVAVCGLLDLRWPFPLPTVDALDGEALADATRRGVRSLTVRALLGVDSESGSPGLNADVAEAVMGVVGGSPLLVSGLIDEQGSLRASGSSAYVVSHDDDKAILGTTTATGIHVLSTSAVDEARDAFLSLVENALVAGIAGSEANRLVVLKSGEGERALAVSKGQVAVGAVGADAVFVASTAPATHWSRAQLDEHFAA